MVIIKGENVWDEEVDTDSDCKVGDGFEEAKDENVEVDARLEEEDNKVEEEDLEVEVVEVILVCLCVDVDVVI